MVASTSSARPTEPSFTLVTLRKGFSPPREVGGLEVRLEARPHLVRQLLEARRVDEEQRDARDLVDGTLDAGFGRIRRAKDVLDLACTVAERVFGHRLQLRND